MYLYSRPRFSASARAMNKIILPSTLFTCRNCVRACVPDIAPSLSARTSREAIKRGDAGTAGKSTNRSKMPEHLDEIKSSGSFPQTRCLRCVSTVSCFFVPVAIYLKSASVSDFDRKRRQGCHKRVRYASPLTRY